MLGIAMPVAAQIEEVIVTATKREQNVQDVPVAVTVLSEDTIENAYTNGLEGLQALMPSVSFGKGNTTRNSTVVVRGIGTISFSTAAEPSVATVVDGVVLGRSGQAFGDLYDLERVEVLRGPQGTLFGKNASAGVINITTRRPDDVFTASADLYYAEGNETRLKARVAGPLSDNSRGSLTLFDGDFDGYIKNVFNNETTSGYDRDGVRAMFEYDATDDLSMLFIFEDYNATDDCCTPLELTPNNRHPDSEALPSGDGRDLDLRLIDHDYTTITKDSTTAISFQLNKSFANELTLTSITASRTWNNTEFREGDYTSIGGDSSDPVASGATFQLHDIGPQEWRQLSQELRIASPGGERFDWLAGFFYWNIKSERNFTRFASCNGDITALLMDNPDLTCNANDIVSATAFFDTEFNNYAFFGEGTLNLSEQVRLIFGARYTDDEVSFNHNRRNNDPYGRPGVGVRASETNYDNKTDDTNISGKLGIQWELGPAGMIYGTYSQGYKGPAFNTFYNMGPNDADAPIDAEESDAYELGWKFTGETVLLNLSIFQTTIENFQANNQDVLNGVNITRLTNAGDVSTEGIEVGFQWSPTEYFSAGGGIASIDAVVDKFRCPLDQVTGQPLPASVCTDRSGLDVPFAPDLKYSVYADWTIPLHSGTEFFINGSYIYTDEQSSGLPGNNGTVGQPLPDYSILNMSVGLSLAEDRFRVAVVGKNLGDENYITTGADPYVQVPREAERYFGVNFKVSY